MSWYDNDWSKRKQITVDSINVSSTLTDFPMLVKLNNDTELSATAQTDGDDILFTSDDGTTKLNHEIVYYATGTLVSWVKIPTLSGSTNTIIYMYYGNPNAANQENVTGVWDTNYVGVWHLSETSGQYFDSTSNNNDGTVQGSPNRAVNAKLGINTLDINSVSEYVSIPNSTSLDIIDEITLSSWVYIDDSGGLYGPILNKGDFQYCIRVSDSGNIFHFFTHDGSSWGQIVSNTAFSTGQWIYVVGRINSSNLLNMFLNGTLQTNSTTHGIASTTSEVNIGRNATVTDRWFHGRIEECRISNIDRSNDWIQTEYNNQNDPTNFFSLGSQENNPNIIFQRASGNNGVSHTIDVGESGNNRLIIVVLGHESKPGDAFQGTVAIDGKTMTQTAVADNPDGIGNHLEVHTIHETALGSTSGSQTITYSAGNSDWAIHVLVYYGVDSNTPIDSGKEDIVIGFPVEVENISSNDGSLIFMAAGNGSSGNATNWTAPLVERTDGPDPSSAILATAAGIEITGKTNKTYSVDIGGGTLRSTGIVLVFDPAPTQSTSSYHQMML